MPSGYAAQVWEALIEAGKPLGMLPFGVEAQRILRLEKGHILVGQDTDALTNPYEASMGWAVKLDKDDFLGKPSLVLQSTNIEKQLVGFEMVDDVLPEEMNQIVRQKSCRAGHYRACDECPAQSMSAQDHRVVLAAHRADRRRADL